MLLNDTLNVSEDEMDCRQQIAQRHRAIKRVVYGVRPQMHVSMKELSRLHSELALLYSTLATFYPNATDQEGLAGGDS